jgi:hypothetical protein
MGLGFISVFWDVTSTIYLIGYSTLIFSKLFTIQGGKVSCLRVFFDCSGGKGCAFLFIYLFSCPK